jgi:HSP20 family protein
MFPTLLRPWVPATLLAEFDGDGSAGAPFPALNVWSEGDTLHVEAELPGVPLEALEITVQGDELVLAGERRAPDEGGVTEHRRERAAGRFSRLVRLPVEVDAQAVQARLRDGVLTITLPRSVASRPRRIEVKPAG